MPTDHHMLPSFDMSIKNRMKQKQHEAPKVASKPTRRCTAEQHFPALDQ